MQLKKIIALRANVVIAFDKDKKYRDIEPILKELSRFTNVYYVLDTNELDKKDSPVDKGKDVWEVLFESRKRYG